MSLGRVRGERQKVILGVLVAELMFEDGPHQLHDCRLSHPAYQSHPLSSWSIALKKRSQGASHAAFAGNGARNLLRHDPGSCMCLSTLLSFDSRLCQHGAYRHGQQDSINAVISANFKLDPLNLHSIAKS